jgi:hypothetical protein
MYASAWTVPLAKYSNQLHYSNAASAPPPSTHLVEQLHEHEAVEDQRVLHRTLRAQPTSKLPASNVTHSTTNSSHRANSCCSHCCLCGRSAAAGVLHQRLP